MTLNYLFRGDLFPLVPHYFLLTQLFKNPEEGSPKAVCLFVKVCISIINFSLSLSQLNKDLSSTAGVSVLADSMAEVKIIFRISK